MIAPSRFSPNIHPWPRRRSITLVASLALVLVATSSFVPPYVAAQQAPDDRAPNAGNPAAAQPAADRPASPQAPGQQPPAPQAAAQQAAAQQPAAQQPAAQQPPVAREPNKPAADSTGSRVHLVPLPLPITGTVDTNVMQLIDRVVQRATRTPAAERPILVLEFQPTEGGKGEGSQFERSLALARFLAGERLRQVRTVAYIPRAATGHAVLVALACEELILAPDAEMGDAGSGEQFIDPTVRQGYVELAERRRTVPGAVALGMLDSSLAVYKVQTQDGVRFVLGDELEKLQKQAAVRSVETVKREGDRGLFTGRDLRLKFSLASHLAADRQALAAALRVPAKSLEWDPSLQEKWRAVRLDLQGPLTPKQLAWIRRSLQQRIDSGKFNFVCVSIESPGGSPSESLGLASYLASLPDTVKTVAFVPREARADAGLIALACDELVVGEAAQFGGPGASVVDLGLLTDARAPLQEIASRQHVAWSPLFAMLDPTAELHRYTHGASGETRLLIDEEWKSMPDRDEWKQGAPESARNGIAGRVIFETGLARYMSASFDELRQMYHLDDEPATVKPTWAHVFIESLASPRIAALLLFIAWFALMVEIATPNMTGAGFVAGLCFLLYFWSKFLHGTSGWLEVLLFVAGAICVALEIFVLPGFGIFGFGGALMMIVALILASQTFVIPRNAYQLQQLPTSIFTVLAGTSGMIVGMVVLRRLIPKAPFLRRLMLDAPAPEQAAELERRESLADYDHLLGRFGVAITRLGPSGKARINDEIVDVISEGDLIDRGATIEVIEVQSSRIVVRAR